MSKDAEQNAARHIENLSRLLPGEPEPIETKPRGQLEYGEAQRRSTRAGRDRQRVISLELALGIEQSERAEQYRQQVFAERAHDAELGRLQTRVKLLGGTSTVLAIVSVFGLAF